MHNEVGTCAEILPVGLLLDVFAEETIQIGLEKAKCPKDKNAVYLEVQKKLEQHGK